MVVTQRDFEHAMKQVNEAFALQQESIEALAKKVAELEKAEKPKKVTK